MNTPKKNQSQKSVGAIVLNPQNKILILFQKKGKFWEFPKGKMERGESEEDTLRRELSEETGIKHWRIVPFFKKKVYYRFSLPSGLLIRKTVVYYLIRTSDSVKLSGEHLSYKWCHKETAKAYFKHKTHKEMIEEIERYGLV